LISCHLLDSSLEVSLVYVCFTVQYFLRVSEVSFMFELLSICDVTLFRLIKIVSFYTLQIAFLKQFYDSVSKLDYVILRSAFVLVRIF
jgi:hypothetical protein